MDRICAEHKDLNQANVMGLNCSGTLGAIAGKASMGLVNLDHPEKLLCKIKRNFKEDVRELQFSLGTETLFAVAAGTKIELLNWNPEGGGVSLNATLAKHGNIVTDISFHSQDTNMIATSAHDYYVFIWDIRTPRAPVMEISNMMGANKVSWERISGKHLATAHKGEIKIFDIKNLKIPKEYISAHPSKLFSLDFSPVRENQLVSCTASTIKMWDLSSACVQPVHTIQVNREYDSVWKVRYTPFGEGLVSLLYPSNIRREPNNLLLWSTSSTSKNKGPVHRFYGNMDSVLEFSWRNIDPIKNRENQLVTWGKDSILTMWPIGAHLKLMCDPDDENSNQNPELPEQQNDGGGPSEGQHVLSSEPPVKNTDHLNAITGTVPIPASLSGVQGVVAVATAAEEERQKINEDETIKFGSLQNKELSSSIQSENLQTQQQQHPNVYDVLRKEISNVNYGEKLVIDKIDLNNRHCIFQTETNLHLIHLDVKFPLNYPMEPPQFSFLFNTTINQEKGYAIIKRLKNLAQIYASRKEVCLEHCLKAYEQEMVNIIKEEKEEESISEKDYRDSNVPYPRISGARFCGRGQLVCFGWTYTQQGPTKKTPRAYSSISGNAAAAGSSRPYSVKIPPTMIKVTDPPKHRTSHQSPRKGPSTKPKMVRIATQTSWRQNSSTSESDQITTTDGQADAGIGGRYSMPMTSAKPSVTIYDSNNALKFHLNLAKEYKINGNSVEEICLHNAKVSFEHKFPQYGKSWILVARIGQMMTIEDRTLLRDYLRTAERSRECKSRLFPTQCSCNSNSMHQNQNLDHGQQQQGNSQHHHEAPFHIHPMGRKILERVLSHYIKLKDVQMVATLCCVFTQALPEISNIVEQEQEQHHVNEFPPKAVSFEEEQFHSGGNSHEDDVTEALMSASVQPDISFKFKTAEALSLSLDKSKQQYKRIRSNSESEFVSRHVSRWFTRCPSESEKRNTAIKTKDHYQNQPNSLYESFQQQLAISSSKRSDNANKISTTIGIDPIKEIQKINPVLYLDPKDQHLFDEYKILYMDMLTRWKLFVSAKKIESLIADRSMINLPKFSDENLFPYIRNCQTCNICNICQLKVYGSASYCLLCFHGGHIQHMQQWFKKNDKCPAGCGCLCIKEMSEYNGYLGQDDR